MISKLITSLSSMNISYYTPNGKVVENFGEAVMAGKDLYFVVGFPFIPDRIRGKIQGLIEIDGQHFLRYKPFKRKKAEVLFEERTRNLPLGVSPSFPGIYSLPVGYYLAR